MPSDAVDYLIKELEMQFAIEKAARDRTETMVQYLLTTIGAVIGAVFLVTGLTENGLLVIFLALLLVFVFAVTTFYRFCRLRNIISHTRASRYLIRYALQELGVTQVKWMMLKDGARTGFSKRVNRWLIGLALGCGLLAAALAVGVLVNLRAAGVISNPIHLAWYLAAGVLGFAAAFAPLRYTHRVYEKVGEQMWVSPPMADLVLVE